MLSVVIPVVVAIVTITVPIPAMVVLKPSTASFPVSGEILSAVISRAYPHCAFIGSPGPVTSVPAIVISLRIPIPFDPDIIRTRTRYHPFHPRPWRRADTDGYLTGKSLAADEQDCA